MSRSETASGHYRSVRRWCQVAALALVAALHSTCSDATAPVVRLQLRGIVRSDGVAMAGVRVFLQDRRSVYEAGVLLGNATSDGNGYYEITARAERPDYVAGCDFLILFIEEFQYFTAASAPIRCVAGPQTIDLTAINLTY